jgi:2-oxopent-4-enoate/cis-2-oxohex-4-enoate hydratase
VSVWAREDLTRAFARQLRDREAAIASGATAIGWKLGFGSAAAFRMLGIDAPLIGYLLRAGVVASGDAVPLTGWTTPKIETEIAVYVDDDVPAGASPDRCRAAIGAIGLAFELVDFTVPPTDAVEILERNVFQRHVILGRRCPYEPGSPLAVSIAVNGKTLAADANPVAAVGEIGDLVAHVADVVGRLGAGLIAGEIIMTGAVAPAAELAAGDEHVAWGSGLGQISVAATGEDAGLGDPP